MLELLSSVQNKVNNLLETSLFNLVVAIYLDADVVIFVYVLNFNFF